MDKRTRKLISTHKALQQKDDIDCISQEKVEEDDSLTSNICGSVSCQRHEKYI